MFLGDVSADSVKYLTRRISPRADLRWCDVNGNPTDRIPGAVEEMRVGPSKPACRSRLQTRQCCCGPKGHGGERLLQKSAREAGRYELRR
jgi:hypothetical protein